MCSEVHTCHTKNKDEHLEYTIHNGQNVDRIPACVNDIVNTNESVKRLDLSENQIKDLSELKSLMQVEDIVLDKNALTESILSTLPLLPNLTSLSLNKNKLSDMEQVLQILSTKLPRLTYLSLLGNPVCPDQITNADVDEGDYHRYKIYVLHRLPTLKFLDFKAFTESDKSEAKVRGQFFKIIRPTDSNFKDRSSHSSIEDWIYTPLPQDVAEYGVGTRENRRVLYGRAKPKFQTYSRRSEGNRFIRNQDL